VRRSFRTRFNCSSPRTSRGSLPFFNLPTHVWVGLNSLRFFDSDNTETALLALKKLAALFEFRNQLAGEERAYPFAAPALEFEAVNIGTSNYQIVTVGPPPPEVHNKTIIIVLLFPTA